MSERRRLLKNVEETAEAMRVLNMLTQPILNGIHRREVELCDENVLDGSDSDDFKDAEVLKFSFDSPLKLTDSPMKEPLESHEGGSGVLPVSPGFCKRKSAWSPVKYTKVADVESVLRNEKTPVWTPLRKSKARQSLSCNLENVMSSEVEETGLDSSSFTVNSETEPRTPLKPMVGGFSNQTSTKAASVEESIPLSRKEAIAAENAPVADSLNCDNSVLQAIADTASSNSVVQGNDEPDQHINPRDVDPKSCVKGTEESSGDINRTNNIATPSSHLKSICSPVRCSTILLQAYGEDVAKVRGSIGAPEKVVNPHDSSSSVDPSKVLKGVTAYVEVRRGEDDRTGGFRWKLKQLGALVSDTLTKKVTHVVFQEGLLSTYRKAKQLDVHIVSTHWVMACDESFSKVPENNYPIENIDQYELADPLTKYIRRPKVMSPDLGSGRDDKKLSRRFQRIHRRSMQILSPATETLSQPEFENPVIASKDFSVEPSKSFGTDDEQNSDDDDDDGFLAMLEAQVREKAASRLKKEEAEKAVNDFKAQLQMLLSCTNSSGTADASSSVPLAKIFHSDDKVSSTSAQRKTGQKSRKKSAKGSVSSASLMKNWLKQNKTLKSSKDGDKEQAKEAAVDALSDEILKSMLGTQSLNSELDVVPSGSSRMPSSGSSVSLAVNTPQLESTRSKTRSSRSSTKQSSKSKQNIGESKASSNIMQSWLLKGKPTCSGINQPLETCSDKAPKKKGRKSPEKQTNSPQNPCENGSDSKIEPLNKTSSKAEPDKLLTSMSMKLSAVFNSQDSSSSDVKDDILSSKLDASVNVRLGKNSTSRSKNVKRKVEFDRKKAPKKRKKSDKPTSKEIKIASSAATDTDIACDS